MTSEAAAAGTPRAVVAGHGDFAAGMISAVEKITGRGALFAPVTNRDCAPADIEAAIARHVEAGAHVVFTDLAQGSCTIAARRLQRAHPELVVVTAVNLSALLDFLFAEAPTPVDAARHAVEKGRGALQVAAVPGGAARPASEGTRVD